MFANDTELYKSDFPCEAFSLTQTIESCISDVKVWIVQNKLQLNDNKTEILLLLEFIFFLHGVWVRVTSLFFYAARNLGVIFISQLALNFEGTDEKSLSTSLPGDLTGQFSLTVSFFLTTQSQTLISSLVLSRLGYCNALLAGSPQVLDKIQRVTNCSAHLICKAPQSAHIILLLYNLLATNQ